MDIRPLSIRRAIDNLVSNGLRYANHVRVSGNIKQKTVQIHVEDDGPGIPEDKVKDALKPFARLDAARNQNFGTGAGLGLPIVADIAHAHGGQLVLSRSEAWGGLRATFSLGLKK